MFWPLVSLWYFGGSVVVVLLFAGKCLMSPQFQRPTFRLSGQLQTNFLNTYTVKGLYERLVSIRLGCFMECRGVLPTSQFAYRKGLGTCDALLWVAHTLQSASRWGRKPEWFRSTSVLLLTGPTIKGFYFSSVLSGLRVQCSLFRQFLSNRSCSMSWWISVVANWLTWCRGCLREVFGPQVILLYTAELFSIVENKLYGDAEDSTLVAGVPSLAERVAVTEFMNRDLNRVSE